MEIGPRPASGAGGGASQGGDAAAGGSASQHGTAGAGASASQRAAAGDSASRGAGPVLGGLTGALFGPLLAGDPHRPRVTVYGADGARTELSTASLANWTAKVAGLLTDELGLAAGDRVSVLLPAGWQTAAVLLGAWWAGAIVTDTDDPGAGAAFVTDGGDAAADEVFVVSGHPLGASSTLVQAHQRDFTDAVLPQADRFSPRVAVTAGDTVLQTAAGGLDLAAVLAAARTAGAAIGDNARLLTNLAWTLPDGIVNALLGPLAADGSVVQLTHSHRAGAVDPAAVAAAERVTVTSGLALAGIASVLPPSN